MITCSDFLVFYFFFLSTLPDAHTTADRLSPFCVCSRAAVSIVCVPLKSYKSRVSFFRASTTSA